MCAHATSGEEITTKITDQVYKNIDLCFEELNQYIRSHNLCSQLENMWFRVDDLKQEFNSLKNYEVKLVFPKVLEVFDSQSKIDNKPTLNIKELMGLTVKKEKVIIDLVTNLADDIDILELDASHPLHQLLTAFITQFIPVKNEWNQLLSNWGNHCACFQQAAINHNLLNQ
jgi:hypothetical protein